MSTTARKGDTSTVSRGASRQRSRQPASTSQAQLLPRWAQICTTHGNNGGPQHQRSVPVPQERRERGDDSSSSSSVATVAKQGTTRRHPTPTFAGRAREASPCPAPRLICNTKAVWRKTADECQATVRRARALARSERVGIGDAWHRPARAGSCTLSKCGSPANPTVTTA